MPRFVVDCAAVLELTKNPDYAIPEGVELLALDPEVAAAARTVVEVAPIERLRQRP